MKHVKPGEYGRPHFEPGYPAEVWACCPFCETEALHLVPVTQVKPPLRVLVFRCPTCNIEETYAPATPA